MAITTYAGIMNGLIQPVYVNKTVALDTTATPWWTLTTWSSAYNAGTYDTTTAGSVLSSTSAQVAGQLRHVDPPSGTKSYVGSLKSLLTSGSRGSLVYLCDRLWHSGGYSSTTTTAQTVGSPTWPARDIAGSTNGDGVMIAFEIRVATGASPANTISISYTNQAGTSGRTGEIILPSTISASANNIFFFSLQAGDTGVRSVDSLTLGTSLVSGTWGLVAVRVLALMPVSRNKKAFKEDGFTLGLPQLWDGSVPFILQTGNGNGNKNQITYIETIG